LNIVWKSDIDQRAIPVVEMHLRQVFWSILGQITYLAFGLVDRRVSIHNVNAIPVAIGTTKQASVLLIPAVLKVRKDTLAGLAKYLKS